MAQPKMYNKNALQNMTADELLTVYNRASERVNRQVSRVKKIIQPSDSTYSMYDLTRAPRYTSAKKREEMSNNTEALIAQILELQERSANKLIGTSELQKSQAQDIQKDLIVMINGSYIGTDRHYTKAELDKILSRVTPAQYQKLADARQALQLNDETEVFYEVMRQLSAKGGDMPILNNASRVVNFLHNFMDKYGNNRAVSDDKIAQAAAEKYGKRY